MINGKQCFFGSISAICYFAGAEAQRCRGNWSKTGPQPNMGPYRYLLPPTTYKTKLHSTGPYTIIQEGGFEMECIHVNLTEAK